MFKTIFSFSPSYLYIHRSPTSPSPNCSVDKSRVWKTRPKSKQVCLCRKDYLLMQYSSSKWRCVVFECCILAALFTINTYLILSPQALHEIYQQNDVRSHCVESLFFRQVAHCGRGQGLGVCDAKHLCCIHACRHGSYLIWLCTEFHWVLLLQFEACSFIFVGHSCGRRGHSQVRSNHVPVCSGCGVQCLFQRFSVRVDQKRYDSSLYWNCVKYML